MLTEKTVIGKIEVTATGHVQVRTDTVIERDGQEISRTYHRHIIAPGDAYSNEDAKVQAICQVIHTPDVVAAYRASQEAM